MASQLNIKDPQTIANVTELARLTGRSKTDVVREAVQDKLRAQTKARMRSREDLMALIREIQERARMLGPIAPYSDDEFYDEYGLPK